MTIGVASICIEEGCRNITSGLRCGDCHLAQRKGKNHPRWLGNKASPEAKKARGRREAQKLYPLPKRCQVCKKNPATERHHKDQDTDNNKRENIMFVCHPCHLKIDNPKQRKVG